MLEPGDHRHGTVTGATTYKCKCDACMEAKRNYDRAWRAGKRSDRVRFGNRGAANVVSGEQLVPFIEKWIEDWRAERPDTWMHKASTRPEGPINWLRDNSGINIRRIYGILKGEIPFVPISDADAILTAIGQNFRLANGDIEVVKSPNWSPEAWAKYMQSRGCY